MTLRNASIPLAAGTHGSGETPLLQSEAARAIATGKLNREQGEAFLDAVFTEHGTCQSHEPTRTHARRATENTWGPDL